MEGVSPCVDEFTQGSLTLKQGGSAQADSSDGFERQASGHQ